MEEKIGWILSDFGL